MELPQFYDDLPIHMRREVRENYIIRQKGECYYCKSDLNKDPPKQILDKNINKALFPKSFFNWPVHLHHSHETGLTIGAVHNYCNAVLWQYEGE